MASRSLVFERGILYALDTIGASPAVSPRDPVVMCEAGLDDTHALAAAMRLPDARKVVERLASRRRCFAAWSGNRIVAYGWVSLADECIGEQERDIRLQPREAYIWDCWTVVQFRGRGLYSALLSHMAGALRAEGVRRIWIGTALDNAPSRKGFARAGFQPVLTLSYLRFFGLHCLLTQGDASAPALVVTAARQALLTDRERSHGALTVSWMQTTQPPCDHVETNLRTI